MKNRNKASDNLNDLLAKERPRRRWPLRLATFLTLSAVLGVGLWYGYGRLTSKATAAVRFRTAEVVRGGLKVIVSATGTLEPVNRVDVGTEVSGTIRSVSADFNDTVKKGQVLAVLDTDKLEAQRDQAKAAVAVTRAELQNARAGAAEAEIQLDRLQRAFDASSGRLPSRQELDAARAAYDKSVAQVKVARANIAKSEASLKGFESDLAKAIIRSPIDGLILDRQVEPGQTVAASLQAPVLFTLAESLTGMLLYVSVDEADVGQVREGQQATFVVDAYPDRRFPAAIRQVRFTPQQSSGVVTYECLLDVDNSDLLLRPGMTATADIVTAEVHDAVLVPNVALRFTPTVSDRETSKQQTSGQSFISKIMPGPPRRLRPQRRGDEAQKEGVGPKIWVLEEGRPVSRAVTPGASDGVNTHIVAGDVAPGQRVIVGQEEAVK